MCSSNNIYNPQVNPQYTTAYTLIVTDSEGCVAIDSMRAMVNPPLTAVVNPDVMICPSSFTNLGSTNTAVGGTGPYNFVWSPGIGLMSVDTSNPSASPLVNTSYCVTITDAVGCQASACQAVD